MPAARLDAVQADAVGALGQVEVVAGAHGRDDQSEVAGHLAPQPLDPVEQVAAVADEVDEVEGQFEFERVHPHLAGQGGGGVDLGGRLDQFLDGTGASAPPAEAARRQEEQPADDEEGDVGQSGDDGQGQHDDARHPHGVVLAPQLGAARRCPKSSSVLARVTMMPVEMESSRAGICETRPSPTLSRL